MEVLVVHATVEGQTRRIAERVAETVTGGGHAPRPFEAAAGSPPAFPATAGAAILCAPIHIGRYPTAFEAAVHAWSADLARRPSAFVSVTLAIASDDAAERAEAEAFAARFAARTGWQPDRVHHAAGALRFSEYGVLRRLLMRRVAAAEGHPGSRDREFTDWAALAAFVRDFLALADSGQSRPPGSG